MTDQAPTGVLLMAYGSPETLDEVADYYTHIRGGRRPPPERVDELRARYAAVGGKTPLLAISERTRAALESRLNEGHGGSTEAGPSDMAGAGPTDVAGAGPYRVFLGMKHWRPWIEDAVRAMDQAGIDRAIGLVLAPHYSAISVGGYYRSVDAAQEKLGSAMAFDRIESWHLHPPYLKAVADRIQTRLADFLCGSEVTVVFTAHSLPERILESGDPYPRQLRETSEALAAMLSLPRWTFSYQSAGHTPDPWLGPDLVETVHSLADQGTRHILVAPIGFVSDHLEILYDIDHEAQQAAREHGITLKRTESLNDSPDFIAALAELVQASS